MDIRLAPVAPGTWALAIWDETWNSYNNSYIIERGDEVLLIDTGKAEHTAHLLDALAHLGRRPEQVRHIIATHGHRDHIGGAAAFPHAAKLIHPTDLGDLPFAPSLPDEGEVLGLELVVTGHHTPGSVALFDRATGALFAGDHICFFGAPLPDGQLVSAGEPLLAAWRRMVSGAAADPEASAKHRIPLLQEGFRRLTRWDPAYLCTGHGGVVQGALREYFAELGGGGLAPRTS